jgi:hypothetical protein
MSEAPYNTAKAAVSIALLAAACFLIAHGWVFWPGFIIVAITFEWI